MPTRGIYSDVTLPCLTYVLRVPTHVASRAPNARYVPLRVQKMPTYYVCLSTLRHVHQTHVTFRYVCKKCLRTTCAYARCVTCTKCTLGSVTCAKNAYVLRVPMHVASRVPNAYYVLCVPTHAASRVPNARYVCLIQVSVMSD